MTCVTFALATALASGGCFTTWVATQATGTQALWDEGVREEAVPLPGIEERLVLKLPAPTTSTTTTTTSTSPGAQVTPAEPPPFALECRVEQQGRDAVYHSAFRYGSRWKKQTAIAFAVEAALGAVALLTASEESPNGYVYGAFLAADALGTAATFFIPRKEVYRVDEKVATTAIRSDCPDGLTLTIGQDTFPVDAAGRIGELGEAALAEWRAPAPRDPTLPAWQAAPRAPLLATFDGRTVELRTGIAASISVPPGTLTQAD